MSEGGVADGGVGDSHVGVETGKGAVVVEEVLGEVGAHDAPIGLVVDVVGLAAVYKGNIEGAVYDNVVAAHPDGQAGGADGAVGFSSGEEGVLNSHVGAVSNVDKASVGSTLLAFADDAVLKSIYYNVGSPNRQVAVIVCIF